MNNLSIRNNWIEFWITKQHYLETANCCLARKFRNNIYRQRKDTIDQRKFDLSIVSSTLNGPRENTAILLSCCEDLYLKEHLRGLTRISSFKILQPSHNTKTSASNCCGAMPSMTLTIAYF